MDIFLLILFIVWFFTSLLSISYDNAWAASIILVVCTLLASLFYGLGKTLLYLQTLNITPFGVVATIVGWLIIGSLWSFFKFYRDVRKNRNIYAIDGIKAIDKSTIGMWIFYWPFSMLVYILGDLIREAGRWIVDRYEGIYRWIMKRALGE